MFADRIVELLELLQRPGPVSGPRIAKALSVDQRTVRRDIARLERMGIPVRRWRGKRGGYRVGPSEKPPPVVLDQEETALAMVALRALRDREAPAGWSERDRRRFRFRARCTDDELARTAQTALVKIAAGLPGSTRLRVRQLQLALAGAHRAARLEASVAMWTASSAASGQRPAAGEPAAREHWPAASSQGAVASGQQPAASG